MTSQICDHANLVFKPEFFDPSKAYGDYHANIAEAYRQGVAYKLEHGLTSGSVLIKEDRAHCAMITDLQRDFRPLGRLPVSGTDDVALRTCVRLLNGTVEGFFGGLTYSLDGHPTPHISFDYYWKNVQTGQPLNLDVRKAACLTLVDEAKAIFRCYGFSPTGEIEELGYYQATTFIKDSVDYFKHLQKTDQGDPWVFAAHCMLGTDGTNLHPLLIETIQFMCGALSITPGVIFKGHIMNTDWFGPLCPCRVDPSNPQAGFQKDIVDEFKKFRTTEFYGVAEDFCDYHMKRQAMDYLTGTDYMTKLRFVTDGTAPIIPGAAHVIEQNKKALAAGVKFIQHDTSFAEAA